METTREQLAAMPYAQAIDTILRESRIAQTRRDADEIYRFTVGGPDVIAMPNAPSPSADNSDSTG